VGLPEVPVPRRRTRRRPPDQPGECPHRPRLRLDRQ